MCFSATASFSAAAVLSLVGAATLAQKPERKRLAFALIPLLFATHQTVEGFIWLSLGRGETLPQALIIAYLFIAQVFWPIYAPLCVLLMENKGRRRISLGILLSMGLFVSATLGAVLFTQDYSVKIAQHSLRYSTDHEFETQLIGLYLIAASAPLLISRYRYVMAFGGAVLVGSIVTLLAYYHAAASVWCFFAAVASPLVYLHVHRSTRNDSR